MTSSVKEEALKLVKSLPDEATWEDVAYAVYVSQAIEEGLAESDAGNGISMEEVRRHFGLEK